MPPAKLRNLTGPLARLARQMGTSATKGADTFKFRDPNEYITVYFFFRGNPFEQPVWREVTRDTAYRNRHDYVPYSKDEQKYIRELDAYHASNDASSDPTPKAISPTTPTPTAPSAKDTPNCS